MHQICATTLVRGDIVITAMHRMARDGSIMPASTLGVVTRRLGANRAEVDFGDAGLQVMHIAALDRVELPDGFDLAYAGDTAIEFALRCADAYMEQRELVSAYVTAALNTKPAPISRLAKTPSGLRRADEDRS